jgi:hypothetical protein
MLEKIDDYKLSITPVNCPMQCEEVGSVYCSSDITFRVPIFLDDDYVMESKYRYIMTFLEIIENDEKKPEHEIYVTSEFFSLYFTNRKVFTAAIWHEIGHIHYRHEFRSDYKTDKDARIQRLQNINNGILDPYEKEADYFAVQKVGRDDVIQTINFLINTRKLDCDDKASLAINEFKLRKKAILDQV